MLWLSVVELYWYILNVSLQLRMLHSLAKLWEWESLSIPRAAIRI
jgi:hypothetical protein